ncbi:C-type lectin 37Da [Dendroctonus ponderosae]|uniref:C-type lectin domain-containing protein n=2 Tax=Dendroctonus ponderosae TaxID=77166 RepID=U4U9N1_DENPD|nr:C-type lectin 37Da [Dendroctonus ponderosae]ERL89762.1 hypothetical protein D910_07123 [Dendroctonus ponderosae]
MTSMQILLTIFSAICCISGASASNSTIKYYVSTDLQNWFQALINCKSAGMELAAIPTRKHQNDLSDYLNTFGYKEGYWLSGMNLGNGNYYWASTGSPVIYTNWLPNQPDNARLNENHMRGENCIQWGIYNNSKTSAWNDLYCGLTLKYICQQVETCN